ncbi:magnesium/cobalt transporter CorA [Flavobacterium agrisoli]|uniref:Magnesium transport protein CorA n=1 Tax=Flavobacterium agrisoli TaxID=2793066 RepID=A0A934PJK4_9FLAO|nr:magnesium/cobalt transporter CorA [Flavobacterium agrisoli]MBK0368530.1 magnesium/cobalt transporter CorA [Flavobacterium agrisoli]
MRKIKFRKVRKTQPNKLEYTGKHKAISSEMQLFVYNDSSIQEFQDLKSNQINSKIDLTKNNWLNVHGLNDLELIKKLGECFAVDDFILTDILNIHKRTRFQENPENLFFIIKSILPSPNLDDIKVEQISFLIKEGLLISFQEKRSDFFTHIRERLRTHTGMVRSKKIGYLLYLLLDAVMENFYITIENEEDKIEKLIVLTKTDSNPLLLEKIEKHRDNFHFLKRAIIPLRDSLFEIKSIKSDHIFNVLEKESYVFFSRLHQKSIELLEQIDSDMNLLESASNFYFSAQNHKMNEIMKTLTIVSAIFIPLTFIAGIYGMNFTNMPELHYHYGYYTVLGVMLLLVVALILYFKSRKWF